MPTRWQLVQIQMSYSYPWRPHGKHGTCRLCQAASAPGAPWGPARPAASLSDRGPARTAAQRAGLPDLSSPVRPHVSPIGPGSQARAAGAVAASRSLAPSYLLPALPSRLSPRRAAWELVLRVLSTRQDASRWQGVDTPSGGPQRTNHIFTITCVMRPLYWFSLK